MKDDNHGEGSSSGGDPCSSAVEVPDEVEPLTVEELQAFVQSIMSSPPSELTVEIIPTVTPTYQVVPDDVAGALRGRLRRGIFKKASGKAVGMIPAQVAGLNLAAAVIAVPRIANTANCTANSTLIESGVYQTKQVRTWPISPQEAGEDAKAQISMVAQGVSTFSTAFQLARASGRSSWARRAQHRKEVATRILAKLQANDPDFRRCENIVANDSNPELWLYCLQSALRPLAGWPCRLLARFAA